MNNARRKQIAEVLALLQVLQEDASNDQNPSDTINEDFVNLKSDILSTVECIRDEEQDYLDNMPENLMNSERYSTSEYALENLNEAANSLESAESDLSVEDFCQFLTDAENYLRSAL